jgi:hypothetical protein
MIIDLGITLGDLGPTIVRDHYTAKTHFTHVNHAETIFLTFHYEREDMNQSVAGRM